MIPHPADLDTKVWTDLGLDHSYKFLIWGPDFDIAENAAKWGHLSILIKQQPIVGAIVRHRCPNYHEYAADPERDGWHAGAIHFKTELTVAAAWEGPKWDVHSWQPLHIEPSLQSHYPCSDHGFIRGGRWERA